MSNQFFSFDVASLFMALITIVLWVSIVRVIAGVAMRMALTVVALFALLWVFGYSEDAFGMILEAFNKVLAMLAAAWNWVF